MRGVQASGLISSLPIPHTQTSLEFVPGPGVFRRQIIPCERLPHLSSGPGLCFDLLTRFLPCLEQSTNFSPLFFSFSFQFCVFMKAHLSYSGFFKKAELLYFTSTVEQNWISHFKKETMEKSTKEQNIVLIFDFFKPHPRRSVVPQYPCSHW